MLAAILTCTVIGIADGDTMTARCEMPAGPANIKIRLAEIDAPEKKQPYGLSSQQKLSALCLKRTAKVQPISQDRYGRTVARVRCAGVDVSAELVHAGLAWRYVAYSTDASIKPLEDCARAARRGLWAGDAPMPPWEWRKASP